MLVQTLNIDKELETQIDQALDFQSGRALHFQSLAEAKQQLQHELPDLLIVDEAACSSDWELQAGLPLLFICPSFFNTERFCKLLDLPQTLAVLQKPLAAPLLKSIFSELAKKRSGGSSENQLDEIEREIKALALEYMQELPDRFKLLSMQVEEIKHGRGDAQAAKNEAHKIKGTASSYGVHSVGKQAVVIDECLKSICAGGRAPLEDQFWDRLETALELAALHAAEALAAAVSESRQEAYAAACKPDSAFPERLKFSGKSLAIFSNKDELRDEELLLLLEPDLRIYSFCDSLKFSEILKALEPDLLVIDIDLHGLDCVELLGKLKTEPGFSSVSSLLMSSRLDLESRRQTFNCGYDDYIAKPVLAEELKARIAGQLRKRSTF